MNSPKRDTVSQALAARRRGHGRISTTTATVGVASVVAAGALALVLPGATSSASPTSGGASTSSGSGTSGTSGTSGSSGTSGTGSSSSPSSNSSNSSSN